MSRAFEFASNYRSLSSDVLDDIHARTYGEFFGQNSWVTKRELTDVLVRGQVESASSVLDVGCGTGGPTIFIAKATGCQAIGIDQKASNIHEANQTAHRNGLAQRVKFYCGNAETASSCVDRVIDRIVCLDSLPHFGDRRLVFLEWRRILKPGGKCMFTDPVVVTGEISSEEIAIRSCFAPYVFSPAGATEDCLKVAGFRLLYCENVTEDAIGVCERWREARENRRNPLIGVESEKGFAVMQNFLQVTARLMRDRRLSRFLYLME